jgi:hypothetical protein
MSFFFIFIYNKSKMITYISLSSDKKYLSIDVDTITILKIHLKGDVIMSTSDDRIEYIVTDTNCRIILTRDKIHAGQCTQGNIEIHSDSMSYIDNTEDHAEDDGDVINTIAGLLARAIDLYKQERLSAGL